MVNSLRLVAIVPGHEAPAGPFYDLKPQLAKRLLGAESVSLAQLEETLRTEAAAGAAVPTRAGTEVV